MKSRKLILLAALLVAFAAVGTSITYADVHTSIASGNWSANDTWDQGAPPLSTDDAVIAAGHTVTVNADYEIVDLKIKRAACGNTPGKVIIDGYTLTVSTFSQDCADWPLPELGVIVLDSTDRASGLDIDGTATYLDSIEVEGNNANNATISDTSGSLTLGESGHISAENGDLDITATITNNGRITANGVASGYNIEFTGSSVQAGSCGLFEVVRCPAKMVFNLTSALTFTEKADFNAEAGTLWIKQDVTTPGGLRVLLGTVEVDPGKSFSATGKFKRW